MQADLLGRRVFGGALRRIGLVVAVAYGGETEGFALLVRVEEDGRLEEWSAVGCELMD